MQSVSIGDRVGRLTVLAESDHGWSHGTSGVHRGRYPAFSCACDCGRHAVVTERDLLADKRWACIPCEAEERCSFDAYRMARRLGIYATYHAQASRAQSIFARALKAGKVVRKAACERCNKSAGRRVRAHHPDYDLPLYVIWLCDPCHRRAHHSRDLNPLAKAVERHLATSARTGTEG